MKYKKIDIAIDKKGEIKNHSFTKELDKLGAVYFWYFKNDEHDEELFYIGQANNIQRRCSEYMSNFSVDSPDDFKIQMFALIIQPTFLILKYYLCDDETQRINDEKKFITKNSNKIYLLNNLKSIKSDSVLEKKEELKKTYRDFLKVVYEDKLKNTKKVNNSG